MRRHCFDTNCRKSSILPLIKVWCCGSGKDDLRRSGSLYTAAFHRLLEYAVGCHSIHQGRLNKGTYGLGQRSGPETRRCRNRRSAWRLWGYSSRSLGKSRGRPWCRPVHPSNHQRWVQRGHLRLWKWWIRRRTFGLSGILRLRSRRLRAGSKLQRPILTRIPESTPAAQL